MRIGVLGLFAFLIVSFIAYRTNKLDSYLYEQDKPFMILANTTTPEYLPVDSPVSYDATNLQQSKQQAYYTKKQLDSLRMQDSINRANELRLSSSKSMLIPNNTVTIEEIKQMPIRKIKDVNPVYLGTSKSAPVIQPYLPAKTDTPLKKH